jgi:formate dehydrogenase major subunit
MRRSQENPDVLRLYDDFYGEPNSPLAHDLLHTSYAPFRPATQDATAGGAL